MPADEPTRMISTTCSMHACIALEATVQSIVSEVDERVVRPSPDEANESSESWSLVSQGSVSSGWARRGRVIDAP